MDGQTGEYRQTGDRQKDGERERDQIQRRKTESTATNQIISNKLREDHGFKAIS